MKDEKPHMSMDVHVRPTGQQATAEREAVRQLSAAGCKVHADVLAGRVRVDDRVALKKALGVERITDTLEGDAKTNAVTRLDNVVTQLQNHCLSNPERTPAGMAITARSSTRRQPPRHCPVGTPAPGGSQPIVVGASGNGNLFVWPLRSKLLWDVDASTFPDQLLADNTVIDMLLATKVWNAAVQSTIGNGEQAFTWQRADSLAGANFRVEYDPRDPAAPGGGVYLAWTWFPGDWPHVNYCPIVVLSSYLEQDARGRVETLVHEIGHNLGLDHEFVFGGSRIPPDNPDSIMSYSTGLGMQATDVSAVRSLYCGVLGTGYLQVGPMDIVTLTLPTP